MKKAYKQNQDRASATVECAPTPQVIELERNTVNLSVVVRCAAPDNRRCDDKREPNAMCFTLGVCPSLEFVKVESPGVIVCE